MRVEVTIPDELGKSLPDDSGELTRAVIEALALEAYRAKRISEYQLRLVLGLPSRFDVHRFLKEHAVPLNYSLEDLEQDIETSRSFEMARAKDRSNAA
jgi:predicted HTH domain antitoxin